MTRDEIIKELTQHAENPNFIMTYEACREAIDIIKKYEDYQCYDDCINDDCSMCIRWNKLGDCYEKG